MKVRRMLLVLRSALGLFLSVAISCLFSCTKDEPTQSSPLEPTPEERAVLAISDHFLPDDMQSSLQQDILGSRNDPRYEESLLSLTAAAQHFDSVLAGLNQAPPKGERRTGAGWFDFSQNIEQLRQEMEGTFGSVGRAVSALGLGYGKGGEIDLAGSSTLALGLYATLTARGGGGLEIVYDFASMQRAIFPFTVCSIGGSLGAGLSAGLSSCLGFDGYIDWISGFSSDGGIHEYKGPAQGLQAGINAEGGFLGRLGISASAGHWVGKNVEACDFFSLIECPDLFVDPSGFGNLQGFTAGLGAEAGLEAGAELGVSIGTEIVGTCVLDFVALESFGLTAANQFDRVARWTAAMRMAGEILGQEPVPGFHVSAAASPLVSLYTIGPDLFAAAAAFIYATVTPETWDSHAVLIITDAQSAPVYTSLLTDLGLGSTVVAQVPATLIGHPGVILSSYAAAGAAGAREKVSAYVSAGGKLFLDGGNPAMLMCGSLSRMPMPEWLGGGQMVYSTSRTESYAAVTNPFGTSIQSGEHLFTDLRGGAYIAGSQGTILATAGTWASAVTRQLGGARVLWTTSSPGDTRNPVAADEFYRGAFQWLFTE